MGNDWFRLYSEFADDPKVQMMPEHMQRRLIMLFCERSRDVLVTLHETELAFHWRISEEDLAATKALFIEKGFIDEHWEILNWNKRQFVSDTSTDRTRRYRERKRTSQERHSDGNETSPNRHQETPATKCDALDTDTDTEQSIGEDTDVSSPVHGASADGPPEKTPDELIYAEYPRKEGHRAALRQIQLAVVRQRRGEGGMAAMSPLDARRWLFRRVHAYARSPAGQNPDKTKIPMPKTWFSQSRYLDDPSAWNQRENANGSIGNRSQQRTDGNIAAARAALEAIAGDFADESGGMPSGLGEQGNAPDLRIETGAVPA